MALVLLDRVRETTFSIGTGTITLAGAVAGYQPFSVIGDGNTTYYTIYDTTTNDWEVGIGTYTLFGDTLSRTTVLSSSNGGSLVSFAAGSKEVFVTYPAEKAIYEQVNGETIINAGPITVIGAGVTSVPTLPAELGKFVGNVNSFAQIYNLNQNDGDTASADFVAYNNLTDDGYNNFTDMGINSSNYTSVDYPIFTPGSGYVFHDGDDFFIGNQTPNKDVVLFAGGADITDEAVRISGTDRSVTLDTDLNVGGALDVTGAADITGPATFGSTVTLNDNPTTPLEAATKQYVDNQVTAGLHIHEPVFVETGLNLTAFYLDGGTTFNITDITGGNTVVTNVSHGLSVNDQIWLFTSAGNGLSINTAYFVYSTPAANQLTLSLTFGGPQISGLTNATGLTYNTRANSGVGATLTNTGSPGQLVIDSAPLDVGDRVMVRVQTTAYENGVYEVTNDGSAGNWVLTRATDSDRVNPADPNGLGTGDYYFTQAGNVNAGNSNVLTTEPNTMIIGYTPLTYTQFSGGVSFVGGTNIDVTGQVISLTGVVAANNGGTGVSTVSLGDLLYGEATGGWGNLAVGAPYKSLIVNSAGTQIEWNAVPLNESGAVSGALPPTNGGTGINAYATGDIIYSDATDSLAALPGNTTTTKKFLNQTGTGSASQAPSWDTIANTDVTGLGTMSTQNANSVAITGGSIENTTVGATTPTTGKFTSLGLDGSTSGTTTLQAAATTTSTTYTLPDADGASGAVLTTNGAGTLLWTSGPQAYPTIRGAVYGTTTDSILGGNNVGLGYQSDVGAGDSNVVIGADAFSTNDSTVVVGYGASALADNTVVVGSQASSAGTSAVVVGYNAQGLQPTVTAIGVNSIADAASSIAIGANTLVPSGADGSIVIGNSSSPSAAFTTIIGIGITPASAGVYVGNIVNGTGSTSGYGTLKYDATNSQVVYDTATVGDVVGPASATSTAVAVYDGTTGKLIKNSAVFVDASNNLGVGPDASTPRQRITLGNTTSTSTATPESIDMGGTFSNSFGQNLKLKLWNIGTNVSGLGVSLGRLDYVAPTASAHAWYTGSTTAMLLDNSYFLGVGPDATAPRQRITLGNTSSVSTATPESIDMGGTYSNAAASNLKLKLYNDTTGVFGVGVSASQMDYAIPTGSSHVWYIGGTARLSINSAGAIDMAATSSLQKNSTAAYLLKNIVQLTSGANATYTTPTGVRALKVTVVGGGGGGGGADGQGASTYATSSGGAGGGWAEALITSVAASYTYTVGGGGAGGAAGNNAGAVGGTTEFKNFVGGTVIIMATGGAGGIGSLGGVSANAAGVLGGIGSLSGVTGVVAAGTGSTWARAISSTYTNFGSSGGSKFGGGQTAAQPGAAARVYGEGGGATYAGAVTTNFAGGAGFQGVIIIEEYY